MKLEHGRLRQNPGVVLYPIYCLINSDCVSNTNYIKTEASLELQAPTYIPHCMGICINKSIVGCAQVRAQVAIKAGQEITTRYVSPTLGNCRRRQHLRSGQSSEILNFDIDALGKLLLWLSVRGVSLRRHCPDLGPVQEVLVLRLLLRPVQRHHRARQPHVLAGVRRLQAGNHCNQRLPSAAEV